jgi:glycosyltransferase involved in cell wall biosynthesis
MFICGINFDKKNIIILKVLFLLFFIFYNINIFSQLNSMISYIKINYEIKKNDYYLKILNKYKIGKKFQKSNNPKISVVTPIYNRELFLIRFLRSIQYQNFQDIEIIFVDDYSSDNSIKIIEEKKKDDERIILLKNKKNKGTFVNRNLGALYAKGKYLIIPDPDDIIIHNILSICYKYAEKYNYEIIRFNLQKGNNIFLYNIIKRLQNKQLSQPEISTSIFYLNNELKMTDLHIYNKLIRTEVYIKALNSLNDHYLNMYMIFNEDQLMNYILHRNTKSSYFLKTIGYYYFTNTISITNNLFKCCKILLKCNFIYLKIIFEYSKNEKYEKDMFNIYINILYIVISRIK